MTQRFCCRKFWNAWACQQKEMVFPPFIVCQTCGNKRCPRATDHELPCSVSNDPGQKGSAYE